MDGDSDSRASEPMYRQEAVFLAETYTQMLAHRTWLQNRINGSWEYTKDMAISELNSITVAYDSERVQSSNISNPTERVALALTDEFLRKKQKELDAAREACIGELKYIDWKIGVVETTVRERMRPETRDVFTLLFKGGKTYEETERILWKKRRRKAVNRNVAQEKKNIYEAIRNEIVLRTALVNNQQFLDMLTSEALNP